MFVGFLRVYRLLLRKMQIQNAPLTKTRIRVPVIALLTTLTTEMKGRVVIFTPPTITMNVIIGGVYD